MSYNGFFSKIIPKEYKGYIFFYHGDYVVRNDRNSILITFGRFSSIDVACAATKLLIKYDWNIRKIGNDLLSEYQGTFHVFKLMDNTLIFDSKFKSYEEAVEYLEINPQCNDYHNDIFRTRLKKKGYRGRSKSSKTDFSNKISLDHIFEKNDKFIVKKSKSCDSFIFGEFDSQDVARAARKILLDYNWELNNNYEISFFNNVYWVFEVNDNKLIFKGKSELYDDALDMIIPPKEKQNNKYLDAIDENYEKIIQRKKDSKTKSKPKTYLKIKNNVNIARIWNVPSKILKKNVPKRIFVQNCDKSGNKFFILDFISLMGRIRCAVNGKEVNWQKRYGIDVENFPEFKLIIKILETNYWDLSKIRNSSSIYFYNCMYYKIQVIKDNTLIFDTFSSYAFAERARLNCKRIRKIPFGTNCPSDVDKVGDNYELVKFKNGKVYKVSALNSLEEIKAIRDILMHSNWNLDIFYEYDLFYLNGIYWELNCYDGVIKLIEKFESITGVNGI